MLYEFGFACETTWATYVTLGLVGGEILGKVLYRVLLWKTMGDLKRFIFSEVRASDSDEIKKSLEVLGEDFVMLGCTKRCILVSYENRITTFHPKKDEVDLIHPPKGCEVDRIEHDGIYFSYSDHKYCIRPFVEESDKE